MSLSRVFGLYSGCIKYVSVATLVARLSPCNLLDPKVIVNKIALKYSIDTMVKKNLNQVVTHLRIVLRLKHSHYLKEHLHRNSFHCL